MTSVTIIISHFQSLPFLRAAIRQIRKFKHPEIEQHIIVVDQSMGQYAVNVYEEMLVDFSDKNYGNFVLVHTNPLWSGYGIDYLFHNNYIKTDYVCQIHCDAFPIHNNWLYLPIKLIEENNLSFVGQLHFWSRTTDTIYPPTPFFSMSPTFNVARTETYKEMSLEAGFTRFHNRPQAGMTWKNNDWGEWAAEDYNARGSDDDTVAFCWEDRHRQHDKLGLAITGFVAPAYGRLIEDLVFHFGSCRESIGTGDAMGEQYKEFTRRINENYSDELIEEMVSLAKANKPPHEPILIRNHWDGVNKISLPPDEQLNKRIEELKNVE